MAPSTSAATGSNLLLVMVIAASMLAAQGATAAIDRPAGVSRKLLGLPNAGFDNEAVGFARDGRRLQEGTVSVFGSGQAYGESTYTDVDAYTLTSPYSSVGSVMAESRAQGRNYDSYGLAVVNVRESGNTGNNHVAAGAASYADPRGAGAVTWGG